MLVLVEGPLAGSGGEGSLARRAVAREELSVLGLGLLGELGSQLSAGPLRVVASHIHPRV